MMKKINQLLVFTVFFSLGAFAQNKTNKSYLKNATTICSLVKEGEGGRIVKENVPLILYMHDSIKNREIEIVFTESMRKKMSYEPYSKLVNQMVCITGKLSEYNNAPAIIINSEEQIATSDKPQINRTRANH